MSHLLGFLFYRGSVHTEYTLVVELPSDSRDEPEYIHNIIMLKKDLFRLMIRLSTDTFTRFNFEILRDVLGWSAIIKRIGQ